MKETIILQNITVIKIFHLNSNDELMKSVFRFSGDITDKLPIYINIALNEIDDNKQLIKIELS